MGFYSPQSLVTDARHHGVTVLRPDIIRSGAVADVELGESGPRGQESCLERLQPEVKRFVRGTADPTPQHRRDGDFAVRLGLDEVQGLGTEVAERIVAVRAERAFTDMADVARRAELTVAQMESLATAGAFDGFGISRSQALWTAGYAERTDQLEGTSVRFKTRNEYPVSNYKYLATDATTPVSRWTVAHGELAFVDRPPRQTAEAHTAGPGRNDRPSSLALMSYMMPSFL